MKKIVFASLVASSALLAGDFFVGADVGNSKVTVDYSEAFSSEVYDSISESGSDRYESWLLSKR